MSETTIDDSQPKPVKTENPASWKLVIADMERRDQFGRKKYGVPLQPGNGRDSLLDAYEEALDLVVYLRNEIEERKLRERAASRLVTEYLNSDGMKERDLAKVAVIDVRTLLVEAGL